MLPIHSRVLLQRLLFCSIFQMQKDNCCNLHGAQGKSGHRTDYKCICLDPRDDSSEFGLRELDFAETRQVGDCQLVLFGITEPRRLNGMAGRVKVAQGSSSPTQATASCAQAAVATNHYKQASAPCLEFEHRIISRTNDVTTHGVIEIDQSQVRAFTDMLRP